MLVLAFILLCVYLKQCTVPFSELHDSFPLWKMLQWTERCVHDDDLKNYLWPVINSAEFMTEVFQTCQTLGGAKPLSPPCLKCHSDRTKWESGRSSWSGVLKEMKYGAEIFGPRVCELLCAPPMSFYWIHSAEMSHRNTAAGKRCSQKERQD